MGGIAKGQIVREIDALGGYSGIITDHTMIQFRMLNRSKGPAMWSPRAQSDRMRFSEMWRLTLEQIPNVDFWQDTVLGLSVKDGFITGVHTAMGYHIESKAVILTNGTFLNGLIHIGMKSFGGGRIGERAAIGLTENLVQLGFESNRMKTGTPVRIDGRSIDFSRMEEQPGDGETGNWVNSVPAISHILHPKFIKFWRQVSWNHPCLPEELRVLAHGIVLQLKIKLTALPTNLGISFLWNRKVGIP
jgi:tRNA uridine 5-carboxymethylaminomethyl modification enzyme